MISIRTSSSLRDDRLLATLGLLLFMHETDNENHLRFDWLGFVVLSTGIGALQMMLDRSNKQDWFTSNEIIVEAVLGGLCIYLFLVHMAWAPRPLIRPAMFRDVNFSAGLVLMFSVGTLLLSSIALMAPWLQTLANYPVATAGLLLAPHGIGNLFTIVLSGRLVSRVDSRWLLAHNTQGLHELIGASVNPFNRALQALGAARDWIDPMPAHGAMMLDRIVNHQAQIIAYVNDYVLMIFTTLPSLLLLLLMRRPRHPPVTQAVQASE